MNRSRWNHIVVLAFLIGVPALQAQTVRGVVTDPADHPLSGVVVQLIDSASGGSLAARALSNQRGEFRLVAPRAGTFRIRTLRIGFRPTLSDFVRLASGQDITRRIAFNGMSFSLDTMRVASLNSCHLTADSGAAVFRAWEQIRTALTAAQITGDARIAATTIAYERAIDPSSKRVLRQNQLVGSAFVNQPWLSEAPDSLRKSGYVRTSPELATIYYAPGLEVLLDNSFTEDHCFHLVSEPDRIGLMFEPAPHRTTVAEIRGTLWLDRKTSHLRTMVFGYANVTKPQEERAGGDMDFTAMRDGTWAISQWNIRMPFLEQAFTSKASNLGSNSSIIGAKLLGMVVAGGELVLAQRGRDTLFMQPPRALRGVVVDSVTGLPAGGAWLTLEGAAAQAVADSDGRFSFRDVLPGVYAMNVNTPALDSLNVQHRTSITFDGTATPINVLVPAAEKITGALCGATPLANPGIVLGQLRVRGDSTAPRDVRMLAEWSAFEKRLGEITPALQTRRIESRVDSRGTFRFCGAPTNTALRIRVESDSGIAHSSEITIPPEIPFQRTEVDFEWQARLGATLTGFVLADSSLQPIAGAELIFPKLNRSVLTNDSGAFRIPDLPPGTHAMTVRRFGYRPLDDSLTITGKADVKWRVLLSKSVTLAGVTLTERAIPESFDDHRRTSLGSFVLRDELQRFAGLQLGTLMEQKRGVNIMHGKGGHAWVQAKRSPTSFCGTIECMRREKKLYLPSKSEQTEGMVAGCYMQVFLDHTLMNPSRPTEPFDLNSVAPEMVEGIEIYAGEAETPSEYRGRGALCGVMVIWSRRSK